MADTAAAATDSSAEEPAAAEAPTSPGHFDLIDVRWRIHRQRAVDGRCRRPRLQRGFLAAGGETDPRGGPLCGHRRGGIHRRPARQPAAGASGRLHVPLQAQRNVRLRLVPHPARRRR